MINLPISLKQYEAILPIVQIGDPAVTFYSPDSHTEWRAATLFSKEPETIEWISQFQADEILLDVGANIGLYSIWAAKSRGVSVYAFEPEALNYATLNRNIVYNQLGDKIIAYSSAISDNDGFDKLYLATFRNGGSCHNFGEKLNYDHKPFNPAHTQGCHSVTIDNLIAQDTIPMPHYIKIDVDGIEDKVIGGAHKTVKDPQLKSILIELNEKLEVHQNIIKLLTDEGFRYSQAQVDAAKQVALEHGAPTTDLANYIFRRG